MLGVQLSANNQKMTRMATRIKALPDSIKKEISVKWNVCCVEFRALMQDRHLNAPVVEYPSPYEDELMRQSSVLYDSLAHDVIVSRENVQAAVWFLNSVADYAPLHEYGDKARGIKARMNMRNEWKNFRVRFFEAASMAAKEELLK
jgi:hypothetical protein